MNNLYDYVSFFGLLIGDAYHDIKEPVNWDKITISVPRDKTSFAFNFEFVEDTYQLGFASDDVAYEIIKNVYDLEGSDGVISLQYGYIDAATGNRNVQFTGTLNLNTYTDEEGVINCSVEKTTFENLARTRLETPITLNSTLDLDGRLMTPASPVEITLHSKKFSKSFKATISDLPTITSPTLARFLSVQIDTSNAVTDELAGNQALPLGISGLDPRDEARFFFQIAEAGDYVLNVQYTFSLEIIGLTTNGVNGWNVIPRFIVQRGAETIEYTTFEQYRQSGGTGSSTQIVIMNVNFSLSRTWEVGDKLFLDLEGLMGLSGSEYVYRVSNYQSTVEILAQTIAEETVVKAYRLYDAIQTMVTAATGQTLAVKSSILAPGGALSKSFITNGYSIRNFMIFDKPVITSIKDFLDSVPVIGGLGYGFTTLEGKDYLVIEPMEYFMQNNEVRYIDQVYDYREEHAKDLVYNEIEIGYESFSEEELNSLDEFNTYQTYLTPIKTYKNKLPKRSKYIASGYLLEAQRREQFSENPSESMSNDDDIFIISCNEGTINYATGYQAQPTLSQLDFYRNINLEVGDSVKILGGTNNDRVFVVTEVLTVSQGYDSYTVTGAMLPDIGYVTAQKLITNIRAEKDEAFTGITGLFSPETSYNIRFSPKRMLFNWAQYINIGLVKKADLEVIKNTFAKNNNTMRSLLSPQDLHRRKEPLVVFGEAEDVTLAMYRGEGKGELHMPTFCYFKAPMDYSSFQYIKQALMGQLGNDVNYGWVYFKDDKDQYVKGFIYSLKYQPSSEIAELQVAKIGTY